MKPRPYVSLVVTARNDDHGGNLLRRMQTFLNAWFGQVKRHGLSSELIVVDWNPPADRPALMDVLRWPDDTGPCEVRFIQVPPEIHRLYRLEDALPLYQMIAKNVAIRRARGEFILATNIDIIFSDELMRFMAERRLEPGRMYRMDRHDVMPDVPVDGTVDEQLEYCRTHLLRICAREGYFELDPDGLRVVAEDDIAERGAGISFGNGWYAVERPAPGEKFRWVDTESEMFATPPPDSSGTLVFDLEPGPGVGRQPFLLRVANEEKVVVSETLVASRVKLSISLPRDARRLHTLRLSVPEGGATVAGDPRIMNFRVFSCGWDATPPPQVEPVKGFLIESSPIVLREPPGQIANGGGLTEAAIVAVSQTSAMGRLIRFCRDSGGLVGAARGALLLRSRSRLFVHRIQAGEEICSPDSGIRLGVGWEPLEHFRGETFRWVSREAELIVRGPERGPAVLGFQIEPGPGVSFAAFELEVRDERGALVATALVERLRHIEIALPAQPGRTRVFSLSARGGGRPCPNGDPRILDFRLFWCGWGNGASAPVAGAPPDPAVRQLAPGLQFGDGWWESGQDDSGDMFFIGESGAEVVLAPHDPRVIGLTATFSPVESGRDFVLTFRSYAGDILASVPVKGSQDVEVELPLRHSRNNVLQLCVDGAPPGRPCFRVSRWGWSIKTPAKPAPASSEPAANIASDPAARVLQPFQPPASPMFLHTNTCGDFTLMAREHWFDLRGYPEFDMYSFHIDSVLCYAAHHGGAAETLLSDPMRCYHIEHGLGSGWTPEGEAKLFSRLRDRGIPWMEYSDLVRWIDDMRRFGSTMIFNRENWGLADYDLPQRILGRTRRDEQDR